MLILPYPKSMLIKKPLLALSIRPNLKPSLIISLTLLPIVILILPIHNNKLPILLNHLIALWIKFMMFSILINFDEIAVLVVFLELAVLVGFEEVAVAIVLLLHPFLLLFWGLDAWQGLGLGHVDGLVTVLGNYLEVDVGWLLFEWLFWFYMW